MTNYENDKVMELCPRYQECSAPKCPLDFFQDERVKLEGEEKCSMAKSIRMRIAKGTKLKYQGMTKAEWTGKQNWDKKPEAEKQAIIKKGKETLKKYNLIG